MNDNIIIKGAKEHNLKNIDLTIPRNKLVVVTGLSGSGKSSLAFDTLYAEGQRRYVESLSSYARHISVRFSNNTELPKNRNSRDTAKNTATTIEASGQLSSYKVYF